MPLTAKGDEILRAMKREYGDEKGERVFYASKNAHKITGVDSEEGAAAELRKAIEAGELESKAEAESIEAGKREAAHQKAALAALDAHAAGVLLHSPQDRVLLLKRSDAARDHPGEWCFPGGGIEDGETPDQAARRELEEETGRAGNDPLVQIDQGDFVTFRQEVEEFEPRLNDEHSEHRWARMDELPTPMHPGTAATLRKLTESGHALDRREWDTNGWYTVYDNPLSKTGVFQYSGRAIGGDADPTKMYGVLLSPEELGSEECVKSFRLQPWTDDHPDDLLGDAEEGLIPPEQKGVAGVIGEQVYFKDDTLYGNIKVFSRNLADKIASGKRELSCGYRCQFLKAAGVYNGEPYQYVQRNVRGNHFSSVDKGRRGSGVRVLDAAEGKFTFALDSMEHPDMSEKRKDEADGTVDAETQKFIADCTMDSFNSLVAELEKKGYSKEYATKIAGKVANEQRGDAKDTLPDTAGATVADKTEVKDPEGKKDDLKPGDAKDAKGARDARDARRGARDARRATDELSAEEEEAEDAAEAAEDAEEEKEDDKDESREAKDRRSARDRRAGARDARKGARDRARDKAARDAAAAKDGKGKGMDAAEVAALIDQRVEQKVRDIAPAMRREAAAVHSLYQRLSPVIGAFDHEEMSVADMAAYGLKKLGAPEAKSVDPVAALDFYLAGRSQVTETLRRGSALDSAPSSGDSFVDKYLAKSA